MQEVFEKIIYNKILEKAWQPLGTFDEHSPFVIKVSDVKEIIEQLAAECENGWIPCSERMPEESLNSVLGFDEYRGRLCLVQYVGGRWILGNDIDSVNITAWQPLPEPYQPEGE